MIDIDLLFKKRFEGKYLDYQVSQSGGTGTISYLVTPTLASGAYAVLVQFHYTISNYFVWSILDFFQIKIQIGSEIFQKNVIGSAGDFMTDLTDMVLSSNFIPIDGSTAFACTFQPHGPSTYSTDFAMSAIIYG